MKGRSSFAWAGGGLVASALAAVLLTSSPAPTRGPSAQNEAAPPAMASPPAEVPVPARASGALVTPAASAATTSEAIPAAVKPAPGVGGMIVGIDPETGKLGMPTPEQMKELSEQEQSRIDHTPADLVEVHHLDGSVSIDLQGRFQEYAIVRIGPDGKKIFQCVDGAENAARLVKMAPEAAPARTEPEER